MTCYLFVSLQLKSNSCMKEGDLSVLVILRKDHNTEVLKCNLELTEWSVVNRLAVAESFSHGGL